MQDEDIIRRRLSRSNNTLLSPLTISSWWSQKAVLRSDWRPSRKKSATSRNNSTVTSYRRPVTFDWLPVTPDQISLTAALVSAWPMVFATVYGPLELSLATGRGAVCGRRSRRMEPPELVDDDACLPALGDERRTKFALWELLASGFRGDSVMSALPRHEWPVVTVRALKSLLELASAGRGGPDGPAPVPHFRQQFPEVELSDLFHDILQRSLAPYARASEHSSLPYKPTRVSGPTDGLCRRQD